MSITRKQLDEAEEIIKMFNRSSCQHPRAQCVYESDDGEFERWQCPDCGERWGRKIAQ